jgi:nucleoside 2-deoxyribosyltransferase
MGATYLAGPINGCTDNECKDWREYATKELREGVIDPMRNDYRGRECQPGIASLIVENDKRDIEEAEFVLVNYDRPSVGTSMEILYAHSLGKPVFVVRKPGTELSPWLTYHATEIFDTFYEACNWINGICWAR